MKSSRGLTPFPPTSILGENPSLIRTRWRRRGMRHHFLEGDVVCELGCVLALWCDCLAYNGIAIDGGAEVLYVARSVVFHGSLWLFRSPICVCLLLGWSAPSPWTVRGYGSAGSLATRCGCLDMVPITTGSDILSTLVV